VQIVGQQSHERKQRQPARGGAGHGEITPLSLGFYAEMRAYFGVGGLQLPTQDKPLDHLRG
jgi:hypothetical protein